MTVGYLSLTAVSEELSGRVVSAYLERQGHQIPPRKLYESSKNLTEDDTALGGSVVGALAGLASGRLMKKTPVVARVGGLAVIGWAVGFNLYSPSVAMSSGFAREGWEKAQIRLAEYRQAQYQDRVQRLEKSIWLFMILRDAQIQSALQRGDTVVGEDGRRITSHPSHVQGKQDVLGGMIANAHLDIDVETGEEIEKGEPGPSGSAPHQYVVVDGKRGYEPFTDYEWRPPSVQEGIKQLNAHIEELQRERTELANEATYLWRIVAEKEALLVKEMDAKAEVVQRKSLELLSSHHSLVWTRIAAIDWMIADSRKTISQSQAHLQNKTWLPSTGSLDVQRYAPEKLLKDVKKHAETTTHLLEKFTQAMADPQTPQELKTQVQESIESVKQNVEASNAVVKEFEKRVADAYAAGGSAK